MFGYPNTSITDIVISSFYCIFLQELFFPDNETDVRITKRGAVRITKRRVLGSLFGQTRDLDGVSR